MKKTISLELKKKIGQMFLCGFDDIKINNHIENLISNYYLGNIILFSRNLKDENQIIKLNNDLKNSIKNNTGYTPFISIDEEGGSVSRLRDIYGEFLGHYAIGALNDRETAFNIGQDIGKKLKDLGINMNLAPVADINSNPENIGIGIRSFGSNQDLVKNMAIEMYKGYESSNILPTLKHFPGLGDVSVDSHHQLPILKKSLDNIFKYELEPFIYGINSGVKSIMVSHIIFKSLDEEYPASMSKKVITDLLKNKLKYDGLIMTDCFEMGAIQKNYGTKEAVIIALNAGIDIFDISHSENLQVEAIEGVYEAIINGTISEERINESYNKIIKYKNLFQNKENNSSVETSLNNLYKKVLDTNNINNIKVNKPIAIAVKQFSSNPAEDIILNPINIDDIFEDKTNIKTLSFNKEILDNEILNIIEKIKDYDDIILFVGDMDIYKNQYKLYNSLKDKNIYLIDMRLKADKLPFKPKVHFLAYSYTNETTKILCNYLNNILTIT